LGVVLRCIFIAFKPLWILMMKPIRRFAMQRQNGNVGFNKLRAAIPTGLAGSGIDVIRIGDQVRFQSNADFTVTRGGDAGTGGLAGVAASANLNATDKLASSDPTADAQVALAAVTTAIATVGTVQGKVGTAQTKLGTAIQLAQAQINAFAAAESRIRDADVAAEAANLTKAQVLQQASLAALAQANARPQAVLALVRG